MKDKRNRHGAVGKSSSEQHFRKSAAITRDAPNMLKNLPIIPSRTSQNLSLLFFKIPPIIPKLFCSDSKKIMTTAN